MKLNRIVPLCLLAMLPFPTVAIARETREEAQRQQREEKQQTVRPYEPNVVERVLKAVETGGIPLITRDGLYAKLGSITTGSGFAYGAGYRSRRLFGADAALNVGEGLHSRGTEQPRGAAFGFRILRRPISGRGLRPALRVSTGRLLWSRSGLASVRAGRLSAARSDDWCASGYAPGSRRLARWRPRSYEPRVSDGTDNALVSIGEQLFTTRHRLQDSQGSRTTFVPSRSSRSTRGGR